MLPNFSKRQWSTLLIIGLADFANAICVSLQAPFFPHEVRIFERIESCCRVLYFSRPCARLYHLSRSKFPFMFLSFIATNILETFTFNYRTFERNIAVRSEASFVNASRTKQSPSNALFVFTFSFNRRYLRCLRFPFLRFSRSHELISSNSAIIVPSLLLFKKILNRAFSGGEKGMHSHRVRIRFWDFRAGCVPGVAAVRTVFESNRTKSIIQQRDLHDGNCCHCVRASRSNRGSCHRRLTTEQIVAMSLP